MCIRDRYKDMQKKNLWIGLVLALVSTLQVKAQNAEQDSTQRKWYVGSTLYLLGNLTKKHNHEYRCV